MSVLRPQAVDLSHFSRFRSEYMGVAMLAIILFHVALPRSSAFFGLRRLGNVGVDIFLLLSGVGMWFSWTKNAVAESGKQFLRAWASFYRRRLWRVYPTWLLVACLYYIPRYNHGTALWADGHGLIDLAGDILVNWDFWLHDELTFWYIPAIMLLYVFAPPFIELVRRNSDFRWLVLLPIVWTVAVQWVTPVHEAVGHIEIFWSRVPIFFIGICMGEAVQKGQRRKGSGVWLVGLLFLASLLVCLFLEQNLHGRFPLFIERLLYIPLAVTLLILLGRVLAAAPKRLNAALAWVGTISLETYLLHSQFVLWRVEQYHLGYWLTFLITLAVSLPLAWVLHRLMQRVTSMLSKVL
jgi:peptidoglycan/LPS O-acetylase OafA/YrhL